jgi:PAS domain-containing protein
VQFAPTANIAIAELEEKDWTVMLVMPIHWRHCSLPGIDLHKRFWMIDASSKQALYVNQAYEAITGRSRQSLMENPSSYEDVIHPR